MSQYKVVISTFHFKIIFHFYNDSIASSLFDKNSELKDGNPINL